MSVVVGVVADGGGVGGGGGGVVVDGVIRDTWTHNGDRDSRLVAAGELDERLSCSELLNV